MNYHELKELAERADETRGIERNRLVRRLIKGLPEMDALERVSSRALSLALEIAEGKRTNIRIGT